jgi:hypothetical protein
MTIQSQTRKTAVFAGNSITTTFAFTFKVFDADEVYVVKANSAGVETVLTLTTDYTVSLNADQNSNPGGSITLVSALPTGETMIISSTVEYLQTVDLTNQGGFYPSVINTALDRLTILTQQLKEEVDRSAKLSITSEADAETLVSNINTLATNLDDLTTIVNNIADIVTCATDLDGSDTIGTTATNISNVNTVAGISGNVTTVAGISSNVTTVAGVASNVTTVAGIASDVSTVAADSADIQTVAADGTDIGTVATNIANVNTVGGISANVTTVAGIASDVTTVAADGTDIGTVATNIANVNAVGAISGNVTTVAGIASDVTTVAADGTDIGTVATNIANVNTVAGISSDVTTVAADGTDIGLVAGVSSDVSTVAGQISPTNNIGTVSGIAANVSTVAGISGNVTTVAGIASDVTAVAADATDIGTVASNIADVNTVAGDIAQIITTANDLNEAVSEIETVANNISIIDTVGTNITNVNTVAGISTDVTTAANNVTDISNFADIWYGPAASAPSTRADGGALQAGDMYFNTSDNQAKVYDGSGFISMGSTVNGTADRFKYVATASQTTFSGSDANGNTLAYDAGYIDVYLNGVHLDPTDYTATSGTSIVLASGAALSDELYIVAYGTFVLNSTVIDDITDVTVTSVADNEVLAYDSGTSKWINQTAAEAGLATTSDVANSSNWDTAYGWGDHGAQGYATTAATVAKTATTGSGALPSGTTAERDGSPSAGYIRFNSDLTSFEGYNGSAWGSIGGGASGGGSDGVFYENDQTVTTNYTLTSNKNAMSTGPITIDSGVTVTIPTGSRWVVI